MDQFGVTHGQGWIRRCQSALRSSKYLLNISVLLSIAFMVFVYSIKGNWLQRGVSTSSVNPIPESGWYEAEPVSGNNDGRRTEEHGGVHEYRAERTMNTRTLVQLMADQSASPTFSLLANVTQHRKGLPNYYIHGLRSGMGEDYAKCNIAFVHLHKAGGTTTKALFRKARRKARMNEVKMSNRVTTSEFDRFLQKGRTPKPTLFWGGFSFGICDVLHKRPCSYMTVLRNPYDRIISSYFFCFTKYSSRLCGPVRPKDVSITAWAIHQGSHFFNLVLVHPDTCRNDSSSDEYVKLYQDHTKDIIQYVHRHEDTCWFRQKALHKEALTKEQRRALLHYILDNLENWFAVIGMLEDYRVSLELFGEAYQMNFTAEYSVPLNTGGARVKEEDTTIKQMKIDLLNSAEVREALYEDIMIYEKALEIMKLQKEEYSRIKNIG
ncbi:uncharacterized protein LOC752737 isoform X1 [Strongylocentrotus purpuratus]|uniref:Uncharacterized protein n=1 Tax=Strongylocentrotus purpuratus TaxID=7668 RepID=A0A7M7HE78_STRPU|nr:uncharacterized protein LOC752737 isoform X1 [Strongylocentrotus purpuratus]XP_011667686.2 uncharacterized protein LOC752737 isoform X1 [Strongylocentrotus purpuratus]